jgi:HK97 gp10 family phage protein
MKIQNRERLRRKIAALPGAVRDEITQALRDSANEISDLQRRFVPVEDGVLRGTIRNSVSEADLRATMTAGGPETTKPVREGQDASYDYAFAQEFGTAKMPARPFFFPGYRLGKKKAKGRIARAINKAARRVAGG